MKLKSKVRRKTSAKNGRNPVSELPPVEPMFAATVRIWWFLRHTYARRDGWPVRDAASELEVHPKTIHRYVRFLSKVHTDGDGEAVVVIEHRGRIPHVVLKKRVLPFADTE